jgi:hypothetical protein
LTSIDPDRPSVFIGHGSLTGDQHASLLSLIEQLKEKDYQVFLDVDEPGHRAGTEFREPLDEWLHDCEACILIFTPEGIVSSDWLPNESFLVGNRMRREPEFILVTVFAGGAQPDQLTGGKWRPHRLDGLEGLTYEDPDFLDQLIGRLDVLHVRRRAFMEPLGKLVVYLTTTLRSIPPQLARVILHKLGHRVDGVRRVDLPLQLTLSLLATRDVDSLGESVMDLVPFDTVAAHDVFRICLPFAWLDDGVADALREAYSARPTRRAAATWTKSDITCGMLVRRACAQEPPWPVCVIPDYAGDNPSQDLLEAARRALVSHYWPPGESVSDDALRRDIELNPCVLVIPPPMPDTDVLEPLRSTFPSATLLFSAVSYDDVRSMGHNDFVVYLDTLPPPEVETEVLYKRRHVLLQLKTLQASREMS